MQKVFISSNLESILFADTNSSLIFIKSSLSLIRYLLSIENSSLIKLTTSSTFACSRYKLSNTYSRLSHKPFKGSIHDNRLASVL